MLKAIYKSRSFIRKKWGRILYSDLHLPFNIFIYNIHWVCIPKFSASLLTNNIVFTQLIIIIYPIFFVAVIFSLPQYFSSQYRRTLSVTITITILPTCLCTIILIPIYFLFSAHYHHAQTFSSFPLHPCQVYYQIQHHQPQNTYSLYTWLSRCPSVSSSLSLSRHHMHHHHSNLYTDSLGQDRWLIGVLSWSDVWLSHSRVDK